MCNPADRKTKTKRGSPEWKAKIAAANRRYHAEQSAESRATWRENISSGTAYGLAALPEEKRAEMRAKQSDAASCRIWQPHTTGYRFPKGRTPVGNTTPDALARRTLTQVRRASIARIAREIAEDHPDRIREALLRGIDAEPPRSISYLILLASYIDGRPVEASHELHTAPTVNLTGMSREELYAKAVAIATTLRESEQQRAERIAKDDARGSLPVIDAEVVPTKEEQ